MRFAVTRDGTTLVTLHEGTDTTAIDAALEQLQAVLDDAETLEWHIDEGRVHEHPAAPFDPYTVAVDFSVTVAVDASTEDAAVDVGERAIADAITGAGLEGISYSSAPRASAA